MNNRVFFLPVAFLSVVTGISLGCAPAAIIVGTATAVAVAHDPRTAGTMVDDQSIEIKISNRILSDKELTKRKRAHINATSYNGIVLLTGEAVSTDLRDKAIDLTKNINKVKRVYNAIKILPPTSLRSRNNDVLITTRVKTKLLAQKEIDGTHFKVVTEHGSVFLMGLVSHTHADIAANTASLITGVKRVVKVFEYTD